MRAAARHGVAAAVVATALACVRPGETLKLPEVPYTSEVTTFASGLRLVAVQTPQPDRFMVALSFPAGSGDDPAGQEGLAHLVEHLTYRARLSQGGAPRVGERLAGSGWRYDAMTYPDATDYWAAGPPEDLDAALAVEAHRLRSPLEGIGDAELERERAVVQSELREYMDRAPARDALVERAFPHHPYGHAPRGNTESIARASLASAREFVAKHYAAAGAIVTVVAPFAPADTLRRVQAAFGPLATGPTRGSAAAPASPPAVPAPPAREPLPITGPVERPSLFVGWATPGRFDRRTPDPDLVATALEAVIAQRLQASHLGDDVGAVQAGFTDIGELGLVWARVELKREAVWRGALGAIQDAAGELPRVGEPQRTFKDWVLVDGYLALEQVDPPAFARYLRATGDGDYLSGWQRWARARFELPLHDFAKTWIRAERAASVLLAPDRNVEAREIDRAVATGPAPPRLEAPPAPQGTDRRMEDEASAVVAAPAALSPPRSPGLDSAERRTFANGLQVVIARRPTLPIAEVRLVVRTDAAGTPGVPPLVADLALAHSVKGFSQRHALDVGASTSTWVGWERVVVRRRGVSRDLPELLKSLADWAREQELDAPAVERSRRALQRRVEWLRTTASRRAWSTLRARLFPDHPYGADPRVEGLLQLTPGQAQRWIDTQLRPERSTLIIVSDRPPTPELWSAIEDAFAGWPRGRGGAEARLAPPRAPERRTVTVVHRPGATQSLVIVGFRAPESAKRDLAAYDATRWLLTSRLNQRLRVEEGTSYGVASFTLDFERAAALVVTAGVEAPDTARSLHTILDGAATLRDEGLDAAAAARAAWVLTREYSFRFDSVAGVASMLERLAVEGRPPATWEDQPRSIAILTPERIASTARSLAIGREAIVVLGNAPAIVPALRAAGFIVEVEELPVDS